MGGAPPGREGRNLDHFALRIERLEPDIAPLQHSPLGARPRLPVLQIVRQGLLHSVDISGGTFTKAQFGCKHQMVGKHAPNDCRL
jgi:hypothetical protein